MQVIIDEAGMINLPMALVPIYLTGAKKVTFVGDPKQLPPFLDKVSFLFFIYLYYEGILHRTALLPLGRI